MLRGEPPVLSRRLPAQPQPSLPAAARAVAAGEGSGPALLSGGCALSPSGSWEYFQAFQSPEDISLGKSLTLGKTEGRRRRGNRR